MTSRLCPSRTMEGPVVLPFWTGQRRMLPSSLAEAIQFPLGATATALTLRACPASVSSSLPVVRSHSFSVRSALPETAHMPSGSTPTLVTVSVWPGNVYASSQASFPPFQAFTVLSTPPVISHLSLGQTATALIAPACPLRVEMPQPRHG